MKRTGRLEVTTPSDREISISREFSASRERLFEAWTRPQLLRQWNHGPDEWPYALCEMDLRVGGKIRWVWPHTTDGAEMGLRGAFREIIPPERLVFTELFDEDWTGGETLVTLTLAERPAKTKVTMTIFYSSREARDGALASGMLEGMSMGYDRLDAVLVAHG